MFVNRNQLLISLFLLVVVICAVFRPFASSNVTLTTERLEPFSVKQEDFIDESKLKQASPDEYAKIQKILGEFRQDLAGEIPALDQFVRKAELPNQSCVVSKAVDKDSFVKKSALTDMKECPVPGNYDPTQYVAKSTIQAKTCPPQEKIDTTKWVLRSTIPPPSKCASCICPKVKVSAGLCKKCPPPPKCPAPKPCPSLKCPDVKPCPPPAPCPDCPLPEPCPPKICPACPTPSKAPERICPTCPKPTKIVEKVYLDTNGKEIKRVVVEEGDEDAEPVVIPCPATKDSTGSTKVGNTNTTNAQAIAQVAAQAAASQATTSGTNSPGFGNWFSGFLGTPDTNHNGLATPEASPSSNSPTHSGSDTIANNSITAVPGMEDDESNQYKITQPANGVARPTYTPTKAPLTRDDQKCRSTQFNQAFKEYSVYGK